MNYQIRTNRVAVLGTALALAAATQALAATPTDPAAKAAAASGQDQGATPNASVEITAQAGGDDAYRVPTTAAPGPLGPKKLLDIPHEVVVLPESLLENVQAKSVKEALKYVPLAQFQEQQGSEILRPATRGMQGSNYQNTRQDGMTIFITGANPLEMYEQVEVFSGLPASIYGPANPAGTFNFVTKRATAERRVEADVDYQSASILTGHLDLGGKIDQEGIFSYRLNVLDSHGTAYVEHSRLDRQLASLGLAARPSDGTLLELNLSKHHLQQKGYPGWFTYGQNTALPSAPDPTRVGYGQSYAGVTLHNNTLEGKWTQSLAPDWVLVVGALTQGVDRNINTAVNGLTDNAGDYTTTFASGFAPHFGITSDIAYLNGSFRTGSLSHDLTLGTTGFRATTNSPYATTTSTLGRANINNPLTFAEPAIGVPDVGDQYLSSVAKQQGVNLADTIGFTSRWSLKLALSQDWMQTQNYAKTGAATTNYNKNGLSPMPSLMFKPAENVTTYVTYASSLQQGDIAPAGTVNANTALAPYRSEQWEVGGKAAVQDLEFTLALFRLERPFAETNSAKVYTIAGTQLNKGIEFTAIGRITENLTTYSGATLISSVMQSTGVAATQGKDYVGLPRVKSNVLLEYAIPGLRDLVVSGDWQYTARRAVDDANLYWSPSFSVFDLGARYSARIWGKMATWRLAVENLADEHYWSTIGPSNIVASDSGSMTAHLGAPRTVSASMAMKF
jgi:iron complex outermembrane receptor protein